MDITPQGFQTRIGVVILNWNGWRDTLECLQSLYDNLWPDLVVYVADNGSSDESAAQISQHYPQCRLLELGQNFGFAEGNNRAVQTALQEGCEFILLLNNDTIVASDLLENFMKAYRLLGPSTALGAKIGYYDDPKLIWDFGSLWDEKRGVYHKVARGQSMEDQSNIVEVDHIIGCAMFIPSFLIRKLGMFEPRFFLNFEETDWCVRARRAGIRLYSIPDALVWHKISRSFVGGLHNLYFFIRNRGLWLHNFSWPQRMRWYWLQGGFFGLIKRIFKTTLRLISFPLWIGSRAKRPKQLYRLASEWIKLAAWTHHLIGRYGDCPPWVRHLSKSLRARS